MEQPSRPRRPILLIFLSVVVLAACILLVSAAIAMFAVTWDPCSLIGGAILLPFPVILAFQQYCGTFRNIAKAAKRSAVLLFVLAGFAFLGFILTLGEMIVEGVQIPWTSLILPMLAVVVISGISGWLNLCWSRELKRSLTEDAHAGVRVLFSKREILVAVAAATCVTAVVTYLIRSTPPRYAENVARDRAPIDLPAEATKISFCQGFRGTIAYEFTIDEKGFVEWVESGIGSLESDAANVSIRATKEPYTIPRYTSLMESSTAPESITITDGLYYDWSEEDRGIYAAFDRTSNRAYYYAHFH